MRIRVFAFVIGACFSAIILGLAYTQVLKGPIYRERSEQNSIRVIPLEAPRGKIFDRNGRVLVDNRLSFDVALVYREIGSVKNVIEELSRILGIEKKKLSAALNEARVNPYAPFVIAEDIGKKKAIILEEKKRDLAGLEINTRPKRYYPYGEIGSHIFGYIGRITKGELERLRSYGYRMNDFVGRSGLEKQYDSYLKGADGGMQVEVNSVGRVVSTLGIKEPIAGKSLRLTIDAELQEFCDRRLGWRNGTVLAIDPYDGKMLAVVSKPGFDPNAFVTSGGAKQVQDLLKRKDYPLVNRAVGGQYPPGSVFKVVTMSSALDTKKFSQKDTLVCTGSLIIGKRVFRCWKEDGHGVQNIEDATKNSCNVFFYQLGLKAGVDNISNYAARFGLGQPTGIDLPEEKRGLVPTRLWKRINFKESWYGGETANYAIGQGYILVTPIQLIRAMAGIANNGKLVTPYIAEEINGVRISDPGSVDIGISKTVIDTVREGLKKVVNDPRGTGMKARLEDVVVAGKTGTAQNPKGEAHGWFTGFAPFGKPGICVLVFVEYGGKGGLEASVIARDVIKKAKELGII